mmetsp:Transcript_30351/g.61800  ORF Transcript_30351/g.61800 Transcript_30351/m.61800 type:complete len:113 (+) Transcript_30351:87-425(+)
MARGNQRDLAREKNLKKLADKTKADGQGGNVQNRNEGDSAKLAEKIAKKEAVKKAEEEEEAARAAHAAASRPAGAAEEPALAPAAAKPKATKPKKTKEDLSFLTDSVKTKKK